MQEIGLKSKVSDLSDLGISNADKVYWNLNPADLIERAIKNGDGTLADTGALVCQTGKFTGRSPKDRFIVKDDITADAVWWGDINIPMSPERFDQLEKKMIASLEGKTLYARDAFAGADPAHRLALRVINTAPHNSLFCYNMFLRPTTSEVEKHVPDFTIIQSTEFTADPEKDGTRQENFVIINFTKRKVLIGGTGYTGEIKKAIFSILNFILPHQKGVLSMHCSANVGKDGDAAVFFGLSGTGKTTLSADPNRGLIGDDEHGWTDTGVFNFEGGCYAKVIDLSAEKEPEIWEAIKFGSLVENTKYYEGTRTVDFENTEITQNTRVSYPIHYIKNALKPSMGGIPKNIFFLTCDAYGVLPPISKLTAGQAMYHFISGYTAKVAGTEEGITEPVTAFSACFGAPFLPLHPTKYADMLGQKMKKHNVNIWLINTGWTGGAYGVGSRIKLRFTRAMITAVLTGELDNVNFENHPVFKLAMPTSCPNVPQEVLNPKNTWEDKAAYDAQANKLANYFQDNFKQFAGEANQEILDGAPVALVNN